MPFFKGIQDSINTNLNKFYKKADEVSAHVPVLNRLNSLAQGQQVKTYCCASKTDDGTVLTSKHVGNKCVPSDSGICVPQTFRCFNNQSVTLNNGSITTENKDNNTSKCRYIPNAVNRVLKPIVGTTKAVGTVVGTGLSAAAQAPFMGAMGGKTKKQKSKKQKTKKQKNKKTKKQKNKKTNKKK